MIKLYGFGPKFGLADPSPFVLKTNTYMKMANIDFESVDSFNNLSKAPKGKLPFIEHDGKTIADSAFILEYLQSEYGNTLDKHLSDEQKAQSYLLAKSLEENFYWCLVYSRWVCHKTWPTIKQAFFGEMPFPLKHIVPAVAQKGVKKSLIGHGMGKHSNEEILSIANKTLKSLSVLLADKIYFWGNEPSSIDAILFSFLAQVTICEVETPLGQLAKKHDNLVSYCQRIQTRYYPEVSA